MVDTNLLKACQQDNLASFCYQAIDGQIYTFPQTNYCNFRNTFDRHKGGLKWIILWVIMLLLLPIALAFIFYEVDGGSGAAYNIALYTFLSLIGVTIIYTIIRMVLTSVRCTKKWQSDLSVDRFPIFADSTVWKPGMNL